MPYQLDATHSQIQFTVRHMMVSKARGVFDKWSGTFNLNEENPAATSVEIVIETGSINTKDAQRDGHLRSPDFFASDEFPTATFKSTKVEMKDGSHASLYGDLTIRDVTRPVVLDVEFQGSAKSPWGTTSYGFSASTKINRKDWGLNWNAALETGGVLVGKEVQLDIEVELIKVAEPEKAAA